MFGHTQGDVPLGIVEACDQALRHDRPDLLRGEVDDGHDQLAKEMCRLVQRGDLGAGLARADVRAEVDQELVRGLAGFREVLGGDDAPDAQLHLGKVGPFDGLHVGYLCVRL